MDPPSFRFTTLWAFTRQCRYLDQLAGVTIPALAISPTEVAEREYFRRFLESRCNAALFAAFPELEGEGGAELRCYGSISTGLAIKGSDVDIAVILENHPRELEQLPRLFENLLLRDGCGAQLLSHAKVPILKVCQSPSAYQLENFREWRKNWDAKVAKRVSHPDQKTVNNPEPEVESNTSDPVSRPSTGFDSGRPPTRVDSSHTNDDAPASTADGSKTLDIQGNNGAINMQGPSPKPSARISHRGKKLPRGRPTRLSSFPSDGVGIQCDINFTGLVAIRHTTLLKCYLACDPRVRPMMLFVKIWAKRRNINSAYQGTLSSTGWSLLVLHFLINVAQPPVLPNLHIDFGPQQILIVNGRSISLDNEKGCAEAAAAGLLTRNTSELGVLLRNFFVYYGWHGRAGRLPGGFDWASSVVAIRLKGGLMAKAQKLWTTTSTAQADGVAARKKYPLAIESPFEPDQNVAGAVDPRGCYAIRGEFLRACQILWDVGRGLPLQDCLMDETRPHDHH
jgi:terminal uridylyltransferase